ncbi:MAG TPA: ABC transporter permease, partial [Novosphingobium sp.]|nr:ABC transporter permease [Novosphingobium sp.]
MSQPSLPWKTAWRIARRDLSARFKGLRLLLVCLFLGVGALAAIGTLTGGIERELEGRGRVLLGGGVEATIWQRPPRAEGQAALAQMGTVSAGTRMQAMASADGVAVPVELKAVDDKWPMIGRFTLKDGREARAPPPGSAWIAEGAAERLAVKAGDRFSLGGRELTVGGIIAGEPDRLSEGFALGPVVIVDAR